MPRRPGTPYRCPLWSCDPWRHSVKHSPARVAGRHEQARHFVVRTEEDGAPHAAEGMAVPNKEQSNRKHRQCIIELMRPQNVPGRVNKAPSLPERLPKSREQRHVLRRRPHSPVIDPQQDLVSFLKAREHVASERHLPPGVSRVREVNSPEAPAHVRLGCAVVRADREGIAALSAPLLALEVGQAAHRIPTDRAAWMADPSRGGQARRTGDLTDACLQRRLVMWCSRAVRVAFADSISLARLATLGFFPSLGHYAYETQPWYALR